MIKNVITVCLLVLLPSLAFAQGNKGTIENCAPIVKGKVCYTEQVEMENKTQLELFNNINRWAKEEYGKDVFLSNLSANKKQGTILISSKVELLLDSKAKANIKFRMDIACSDNGYTVKVSNIRYQYDPGVNKTKLFPAEDIMIDNGKGNKVELVKEPVLLCNATYFFVEGLFGDVFDAAKGAF